VSLADPNPTSRNPYALRLAAGLARPFHGFRGSGELKDAKVAFPSGKLEVLKQQEPLTERHLLDEEA